MKRTVLFALLAASVLVADDSVVRRGAAIPADAKPVALASVLQKPEEYAKKPVVVEGVVEQACTRKGCWMQIVPKAGEEGVRVTFKDYGFFVPLDAKGMHARAEGVTSIRTLGKEETEHLESEGAKFSRNADGTAREVSFVASGVELRR